jgi:hypothetical protein
LVVATTPDRFGRGKPFPTDWCLFGRGGFIPPTGESREKLEGNLVLLIPFQALEPELDSGFPPSLILDLVEFLFVCSCYGFRADKDEIFVVAL